MNKEKRNALLVASVFGIGLIGGWLIGAVAYHHPRYVDAEYFIELKNDGSAIIEGLDRHTYHCPVDSIPAVLLRDNL
jgi:hypothetical protein